MPADQPIGTGDGGTRRYFLSKTYADAAGSYRRPIRKPVEGSVRIAVDGTEVVGGWAADPTTGEVTFDAAPADGASVTAGFAFDVPVRFDTDRLSISVESFHAGDVPSIPVVEVRL